MALLTAMVSGGGCESYVRARAFEQHAPLREGSLAWWTDKKIGEEPAAGWLMNRTAVIVGRADYVGLKSDGQKKLTLKPMRAGEAVAPSLGSAVPVTDDGYFLTAAHCISEEPYVIVIRDRDGNFVERLGRTVWSGLWATGRTDIAVVHAPGVECESLEWCGLDDAGGGEHVLSAGVGYNATRLAAGQITGGPIGVREAPPGLAHAFHVDSPLIPGDSGGPTIVAGGRLLGVCANVEIEIFTRPGGGEVLRPDPAFIQRVIGADRSKRDDTLRP